MKRLLLAQEDRFLYKKQSVCFPAQTFFYSVEEAEINGTDLDAVMLHKGKVPISKVVSQDA